ncbi:MAG TPA: indole-3-glycerol phosphate synthase TrpC [Anaerolineae bacterium]
MILDEIISNKKDEITQRKRRITLAEIRDRAGSAPAPRDFVSGLSREQVALIAEIKRASPSRGALRGEFSLPQLAFEYAGNGAAAISVLTDQKYFAGDLGDLESSRIAVDVPILRKDFIIEEYQVYESRAFHADAILLIVRVLSDGQLRDYVALASSLGMGVLMEIHEEAEVERALAADAQVIGINNRNLLDFTVDLAVTEQLAPRILAQAGVGSGKIIVAESGVFTRADVERAARAGARAVLVGEALMRADDVATKVRELAGVGLHLQPNAQGAS